MKQRILSSAIGLVLLFAAMFLMDTVVPNIAITVLAAMAVWELLHATGCTKNKLLCGISLLFSAAVPFLPLAIMAHHLIVICYLYVTALLITFLYYHNTLQIQQVAMAFLFSLLVPISLTSLIYLRDRFGPALGIFYTLLTLGSAWFSDTGAYFTGRKFGKHKLAPVISPKKTVEGAVGGVLFSMIATPLLLWGISFVLDSFGMSITIYYSRMILLIPVLSVISILGDLSASVIKRQFCVKDYGSIMPGHGGVMDRFDSVLLVAPLVFIICRYLPLAVAG